MRINYGSIKKKLRIGKISQVIDFYLVTKFHIQIPAGSHAQCVQQFFFSCLTRMTQLVLLATELLGRSFAGSRQGEWPRGSFSLHHGGEFAARKISFKILEYHANQNKTTAVLNVKLKINNFSESKSHQFRHHQKFKC